MLALLLADAADAGYTAVGLAAIFGFLALIGFATVLFFRGPAKASDEYVATLAAQFQSPADAALFRNLYLTKGPRSTVLAWVLTVLLSPTISYLYQGKWALAVISLLTFQGIGIWWIVSWFTMPSEVGAMNRRFADEAFNQVMIARPQYAHASPAPQS